MWAAGRETVDPGPGLLDIRVVIQPSTKQQVAAAVQRRLMPTGRMADILVTNLCAG